MQREREKRFACVCGIFCLPVLCSFIKKMLICEIIQEEADSFKGWKEFHNEIDNDRIFFVQSQLHKYSNLETT